MAVTQQVQPSKLRHLQSFVSSGTFTPSFGTTAVYVAVLGATGGAGTGGRYAAGNTGSGPSAGGFVQVNPGVPHVVVIGAGTAAAATQAGTTSFDGAITVTGAFSGNSSFNAGNSGFLGNTGAAGVASGVTTLPALNPGAGTVVRVSSYTTGGNITANSQSGIVHVYGY
jgi:hypothetical protein